MKPSGNLKNKKIIFNMEVWKDIEGYKGLYQVSDLGRVKSLKQEKDRILKPWKSTGGYLVVELNQKKVKIHRLVAITFLNKIFNKEYVNHINGISSDNRVQNLEWCTSSENRIHSFKIGTAKIPKLKGEQSPNSKITEIEAKEIKYGCIGMSQSTIAKKYNIKQSLVSRIKNGIRWGHI